MRHKAPVRQRLWFAAVLSLVTAGCGSSSPARTVSYFQAHAKERKALFKRCTDDPGALGKTAECDNAEQAQAIEGIGSFRHLAPMKFPPVPGARVKKRADVSDRNSTP